MTYERYEVVRWSEKRKVWFIVRDNLSKNTAKLFLENWKDNFPNDKVPIKIAKVK